MNLEMEQRRAKKNWTNELLFEKEQGRKLLCRYEWKQSTKRKLLFNVLTKIYFRFFLYKNPKSKSTWICISYMGCLHSIVSFHCHATSEWHSFQLSVMDTSGSFFWLRVESYICTKLFFALLSPQPYFKSNVDSQFSQK